MTDTQLSEQIRAHPVYQSFVRQHGLLTRHLPNGVVATSSAGSPVHLSDQQAVELERALRAAGITLPSGFHIGRLGEVTSENHALRSFLLASAGLMAGPIIAGAVGAGAAGGVGLGETGAVTGLAGSGFGGPGAFGGAGAVGGAAGGVGIGETGAVTGLSGSGFGGGGAAAGIGSRLIDAGARAGLMGLGQRFGRGQQEIPQEVRDILNLQRQQTEIQTQRMQMQNPLFASIMQMAKSRLPTNMQHAPFPGPAASPAQQQTVQILARRRPEY